MKYILLSILFFGMFQMFSQTNVFVSENLKYIDSTLFVKKCSRNVVQCRKYMHNKDTVVFAVHKRYEFGKYSIKDFNQINKKLNNGKEFELTLLIRNTDSIAIIADILHRANYKIVKKVEGEIDNFILEIKRDRYKESNFTVSKEFIKNYNLRLAEKVKCLQRNNKINVLHKTEKGFISLYPKTKLYECNQNIFDLKYNNAIIKPNGEYFKYENKIPLPKIKKILRAKYWNSYKESLDKSLNEFKDGFFDIMERPKYDCL